MEIKKIIFSSLLAASTAASTSCSLKSFFEKKEEAPATATQQMVYAPELDPEEHELITDQEYKCLDNEEPVRFETAVTEEEASNGTPVSLYDSNGNSVSKMYDDGTHSDRIAGDGIYTCSYKPETNGEASFSYSAKIGDFTTEPTSVRYFDAITDKDVEDMNDVAEKISEIGAAYLDSNGNISDAKRSEALNAVGEYAEELCKSGEAVKYRVNEEYDNTYIKLSSGLSMIYDVSNDEGAKKKRSSTASGAASAAAAGADAVANAASGAASGVTVKPHNVKFKIYQPYLDQFANPIDEAAAGYVCDEFSGNCSIDSVVTLKKAKPGVIKNFGKDQAIIWDGHGGYEPSVHSYICTPCILSDLKKGTDYNDDDLIEDRLLLEFNQRKYYFQTGDWYSTDCFYVDITSEYIDAHCPDMTNSFVYLGTCLGTKDSVLAASFINKNCNVVLGYTDSVQYGYEQHMLDTLLNTMSKQKTSGNYWSVYDALNSAKEKWGKNDNDATPAELIKLGNSNYRFADAINNTNLSPTQNNKYRGSFSLKDDHITIKVGGSGKINVLTLPDGCYERDLCWTINNSDIASIDSNGNIRGKSEGTTSGHVVTKDGLYYKDFTVTVMKK